MPALHDMVFQGPPAGALSLEELAEVMDGVWTLACSVLLMLLQPGFALLETGCVQEANLAGTLTQHMLVLMVGAFAWLLFGSTIAFRRDRVEVNIADDEQAQSFFGLLLCLTTVTIALRGMAGRAKVWADIAVALAVFVVLYPISVRWTFGGGWLEELDPPFHTGAGGATLHVVGGVAAAVGARLGGQRREPQVPPKRKKHRGLEARVPPHRAPSIVIGTLVIWVGWYGFSALSTSGMRTKQQALIASRMAVNTTLAAISGGLFALGVRAGVLRSTFRWLATYTGHAEERTKKAAAAASLDPIACCFGAISGLVAIAGGSDCVENSTAVAVGALGSAAGILGSRLLKVLRVDDPMEVGAVHGCAGAVGVISVGLFHRHNGLFVGGGWGLLGSQTAGVLVIGSVTAASSYVLFKALRCLGVLGPQKQRQREELSTEALQELFAILDRNCLQVEDTIEALVKLKGVIWRPFSPQAGNNKIEGEVLDVLNLMSSVLKADDEYLAFISHYKAEAGDVARIIYDHVTDAVVQRVGLGEDSPRSRSPLRSPTRNLLGKLGRSPTDPEVTRHFMERMKDTASCESEEDILHHPRMGPMSDVEVPRPMGELSRGRSPGDGIAEGRLLCDRRSIEVPELQLPGGALLEEGHHAQPRDHLGVFGSSVSTSSTHDFLPDGMSPSIMNLRNLITGAGCMDGPQLDLERLLFLDSVELRDLDELLNAVRRSSNFIILLTKGVLTRPWVLAELTVAMAEQKNIVAVRIEWPCKDDEKHFTLPDCIEEVMQQLEHCRAEVRSHARSAWSRPGMRSVASALSMRKNGSNSRGTSRNSSKSSSPPRVSPMPSNREIERSAERTQGGSSPTHKPASHESGHRLCEGFRLNPTPRFMGLVPEGETLTDMALEAVSEAPPVSEAPQEAQDKYVVERGGVIAGAEEDAQGGNARGSARSSAGSLD